MHFVKQNNPNKYFHELHKEKKCPECGARLQEVGQFDGPDDWDLTGIACVKCDFEEGY